MSSFALVAVLALGLVSTRPARAEKTMIPDPPPIRREFRGAWVATVANIDWPSHRGMPVEKQKAQLVAIMDRAVQLKLNAIVLQVRPASDALYESKLEPWSEYLTGTMGRAPEPYYDPLAFAVEEAHKRGIELHAWFNPYRALHPDGKSPVSANHVSKTHPRLVRKYGPYLWLDPGDREVQDHTLAVVTDVVRRYDVDGVHLDDYFYPYPVETHGHVVPFPDDPSWKRYVESGGHLSRDDWRRDNVDTLIRRIHDEVHREKPWVKFGVSPFGIWRPGNPPQIRGMDPYAALYADSRKWLAEGWVDYFAPQLYWPIDRYAQSFPVLLKWWTEQNRSGRHVWAGMNVGMVGSGPKSWPASEFVRQIEATRAQDGATGDILFSMAALVNNQGKLADALRASVYREPALVPEFPWLKSPRPPTPKLTLAGDGTAPQVAWRAKGTPAVWTLQVFANGTWTSRILPGAQTEAALPPGTESVALTAISRTGEAGKRVMLRVAGKEGS